MLCIQSKVTAKLLIVESDSPISDLHICDSENNKVNAEILSRKTDNGTFTAVIDGSNLKTWSPNHPVLYTLNTDGVSHRFGYCELTTLDNRAVILNGSPCYLRGYIRGIIAHEHPNMTGGSLKDAAIKNIRQAKKYGFNLVRFHSTIPSPEFVEAADEEGLLIHMEIGFAYEYDNRGNKKKLSMDNEKWQKTILKYRNNPSVAIFCIGNEMHKSGHQPEVQKLYAEGKKLAPTKLIMDNSGWGEFDRGSADVFAQHIAYYFPFKHHRDMFLTDHCWRINGSTYDEPMEVEYSDGEISAEIRREAVPLRPVLAHEAVHYIEIPDYDALNRKFDDFCNRVGKEYLEANGIKKPRFMTELPALIKRKKLSDKMPDYIKGSQLFKKMAVKTYLERLRLSGICGYEMLQFADCLKYENKNGIVDCFDDDKYFDADWMNSFNGDAVILAEFENETVYYEAPVPVTLYISDFLEKPVKRGTVEVKVNENTVWTGKNIVLTGNLQKIADLKLNFKEKAVPEKAVVSATFQSDEFLLKNSWTLWLYPHAEVKVQAELDLNDKTAERFFTVPGAGKENIFLTDKLNDRVISELENGKHVFLMYHRDKTDNKYYLPGALERFKPCIWDRGSNLGGFINVEVLRNALATERYFDANMYSLLEAAYKVNLDKCPFPVAEHINGIDKPVRDRMKGLLYKIKDFVEEDTLRNFSHCFSLSMENGAVLTVCTLNFNNTPATENFYAALINHLEIFRSEKSVTVEDFKKYLEESTTVEPCREDVMNHFWEIDNKPVEDTLFWEVVGIDLSKIK